jgi:glutamine amidotransferase
MNIIIIDYGMGNLRSVFNAFHQVGSEATISRDPNDLRKATKIVLPGVGAFGDAMKNLTEMGFLDVLHDEVKHKGKPFLGICLGMQLLATTGTEHGHCQGFDWIPGKVVRIEGEKSGVRIPHIGWNDVRLVKREGLYRNLSDPQAFYFVHSYVLVPDDESVISGMCEYGDNFVASIEKDNIYAIQFHPEKSHKIGLNVLKNFALLKG